MHRLSRAARRSLPFAATAILALLILTACGGGGGGGGNSGGGGGGGNTLTLSLSTNAVTFNASPTAIPAPVDVTATFTGTGSGTLYIVIVASNPAIANLTNVVVTGETTGQGTIVPGSQFGLSAGTHTATIQVRACLNDPSCATGQVRGSPQTINVTYNVTGVASSVSNLTYDIGNAPSAANLTRSFNVTGFPAQTWTIAENLPWLDVTPGTGSAGTPTSVSANLAATPLDALNNGRYTGTITLTPTTGAPVTINVTLNVARTQVNYVAPYVARTSLAGDVIIRGDNFNAITPTGVRFGSSDDATAFNVVSNTEIRASHAGLAAGSYDVHILNGQGLDRTRAQLKVVDPTNFAATTLQYPQGPGVIVSNLVYDAERRAVFATIHYNQVGAETGRLLRWEFTSAWQPAIEAQAQYRFPSAMALTADGTKLLAAHFDTDDPITIGFAVAELDPVTMDKTRITRFPQSVEATTMAVSNDGTAIIISDMLCCSGATPIFAYSPLTGALREADQPGIFDVTDGFAAASEDGSLVLVPNNNEPIGGPPTLRYDSETGQLALAPAMVRAMVTPRINRHATRFLWNWDEVRDANLALLGRLPNTSVSSVLAPEDLIAYAYDNDGTVRRYDLAAAPVNGIYPEILPAITVSGSPGVLVYQMAISPDGGTLFLGGRDQIVVVPLP